MKKIILVVSILLMATLLGGCGKNKSGHTQKEFDELQDDKARLVREVDREIERTNEYKEDVEELKEKNAEQLATIDYLNSELARRDSSISSLEDKLEKSSSSSSSSNSASKIYSVDPGDSNSYLARKFWFDGYNYSANTTWYWDITCKPESQMSCATIISPIVDTMVQKNGYTVYVCMSNNGLVYSTSYPHLIKNN